MLAVYEGQIKLVSTQKVRARQKAEGLDLTSIRDDQRGKRTVKGREAGAQRLALSRRLGVHCDPADQDIVVDGKPIGLSDAGQDWHTDMSYSRQIAFANVLYGIRIPLRDGRPLGNTEFCNMHAAYDDLPAAIKTRIDKMTATHDLNGYWEKMRQRPGTQRKPLTPEQLDAFPAASFDCA